MTSPTPGPEGRPARPSPAVYRRRRAGALLILLLVVAAVVWGVSSLLGGRDAGAAADAPAAETTAAEAATEAPAPGDVAVCAARDLAAELTVRPAGEGAGVEVSVRNGGEVPCLLDAGPASLVAEVSSGSDSVWSSAHCAGEGPEALLLDTGTATPVTVSWDGHRSAQGCPADQPQAGPGTYRVGLELDGTSLGTREVFSLG